MVITKKINEQKLPIKVLSMVSRPAARKFGVYKSTVQGITKNYKEAEVENEEIGELPRKKCGAKTLLPSKLEDKVL